MLVGDQSVQSVQSVQSAVLRKRKRLARPWEVACEWMEVGEMGKESLRQNGHLNFPFPIAVAQEGCDVM
jgi:hypothetical protein